MSERKRCMAILILAALAYFVSYPEDAQAIITPAGLFLNLTNVVSPWFYGVVAVGIIATAVVKTWGGRASA